jgi:hypothetical protein
MKKLLPLLVFLFIAGSATAQITTPVIKAGFGVDAELRANFFNGFNQAGNDDWFATTSVVGPGLGTFIIDTTGASYIISRYGSDPAFRQLPFFRGMRYPQFSVVNNKLLIDGIFIRDHHGDDSTVFASGSNKNGMSPGSWSTPISQGIPDKNDILDMYMHVRRDGVNLTDSMWMFGGVSIDNTTGNRYFDFEMYQTDIYYDKPSLKFYGFGPDAGHTSWKFDASGNVLQAGDIIFTAEYSSSSLSMLEARIWVNQADLAITPAAFNWGGVFDGDGNGATYGYANILPKTAGAFYTGLQSTNNTWAGPFALVLQNNNVVVNYSARQFMEFSVNLSKLGLDPLVTSNDPCKLPFRRILVKSRASTSFTAELKDFVGPFSFFRAPRAEAVADIPLFCGSTGVATLSVTNPVGTSLYTWRTTNGNIVSDTIGPEITVDMPGTYIVSQQLMDSCGTTYATDTVVVAEDPTCVVLKSQLRDFRGTLHNAKAELEWTLTHNRSIRSIEVQRSTDNRTFLPLGSLASTGKEGDQAYRFLDDPGLLAVPVVFYRLKLTDINGVVTYSTVVPVNLSTLKAAGVILLPNPVQSQAFLSITTANAATQAEITVLNTAGRLMRRVVLPMTTNKLTLSIEEMDAWPAGVYTVRVKAGSELFTTRLIKMNGGW